VIEYTPALIKYPDGREVCRETPEGREEYRRRLRESWEEQGKLCAICYLKMPLREATPDHKQPRRMGAGFRDDRQENIAAVHGRCNTDRGSKREGYYDL
jgi:hypothetical protein